MSKFVTIKESQFPALGAFIQSEQKAISAKKELLYSDLKKIKERIDLLDQQYKDNKNTLVEMGLEKADESELNVSKNGLTVQPSLVITANSHYKEPLSWWQKVEYILNTEKKVLSGNEILQIVFKLEPGLKNGSPEDLKRIEVNIFSTLYHKARKGLLIRVEKDGQFKYGMKSWVDKNGELHYVNKKATA